MTRTATALARRQRAGRLNRRLGYISLPLLVATSLFYYVPEGPHLVSAVLQIALLPIFFVHVALSFYVFGVVRPRRTLRVFHIYFGYLTFFVVFASQMSIKSGGAKHFVLTALMYLAIALHIAIGVRYSIKRNQTDVPRRGFKVSSAAR